MSGSPQTAACAWTVGSYPSLEIQNLSNSWITTPAASSAIFSPTIVDSGPYINGVQAFVDINVTLSTTLPLETNTYGPY